MLPSMACNFLMAILAMQFLQNIFYFKNSCERSRQMRTAFTENENGRAACVC